MYMIDKKMKKILPFLDKRFFGLPSQEYIQVFLNDIEKAKEKKAPKEFINFLLSYGIGQLSSLFNIDSELLLPEEIYGRPIKELEGMLVFASDLGEYVYAFDTKNNWEVVDIDASGKIFKRYGDFETFINQMLDEIIEVNEEDKE